MEVETEKLKELSHFVTYLYFVKRSWQELTPYLSEHITFIGTDAHEICFSREEAIQFLMEESRVYDGSFTLSDESYRVSLLNNETAVVLCFYSVCPKDPSLYHMKEDMRISLIWSYAAIGRWKLSHVHASLAVTNMASENDFHVKISEKHKRMQLMAGFDALTGIRNMEGFAKEARHILDKEDGSYAVIKFSICNFRFINQIHGYSFGDNVLVNIAHNLSHFCQNAETCGRIEKDTFAMLYRFHDKKQLQQRMLRECRNLLNIELSEKLKQNIQFIAGIYLVTEHTKESVKSMLGKAMLAMQYTDRNSEYSNFLYYEEWMLQKKNRNSELLEKAKEAIRNNNFELVIQPQIQLSTGRITSGEVLSRWTLEDGTVVVPDEFISLFEEYGIISKFDFYVLDQLCRVLQKWVKAGKTPVPISINQSRKHLAEAQYIENFTAVVDSYDIPHHLIIFELTESAFSESEHYLQDFMNKIHKAGFQIAIDDFGTGFAGIGLLSKVNADLLKLDKILLDGINNDKRQMTIFWKIIEMAHSIGMNVICEGIETEEQLNNLKLLKCDIGQGYFLDKPMTIHAFEQKYLMEQTLSENYENV